MLALIVALALAPQEVEDDEVAEEALRAPAVTLPFERARRELFVADETRPRQFPFLVSGGSTSTLGFLEWTPGEGDRVVLCEPTPAGDERARRIASGSPGAMFRPVALRDGRGRTRVFWTEIVDDEAQLRTAVELAEPAADGTPRFGPVVTLTIAPSSKPVAVLDPKSGAILAAWEAHTYDRTQMLHVSAFVDGDEAGAGARTHLAMPLGTYGGSDLEPAIAIGGGRLWIACSAFTGTDYEIRLQAFTLQSPMTMDRINVSADGAADDRHPALAVAENGDVWIAWDRVENPARGSSLPAALRSPQSGPIDVSVRVACVRPGEKPDEWRVLLPKSTIEGVPDGVVPGAPRLSAGGGLPRIALDRAGRPWVAYRHLFRSRELRGQEGFPVLVQRLDSKGWSAPYEIDKSGGALEPIDFAIDGDDAVVVFGADERYELTSRRDRHAVPRSMAETLQSSGVFLNRSYGAVGIGLARLAVPAAPATPTSPALVPRVDRSAPMQELAPADRLEVRRDPAKSGGESWRVFFGDLHRHSNFSRCSRGAEPTASDRYETARDVDGCDFFALTDHSTQLRPNQWWELEKLVRLHRTPAFCTIAGYEWSLGAFGHHQVLLEGGLTPIIGDRSKLEDLLARLDPKRTILVAHQTADARAAHEFLHGRDDDAKDAAEAGASLPRLLEVYQACLGSFEFDGALKQARTATALGSFAQDALDAGQTVGFVAGSDHGEGRAYTAVLAEPVDGSLDGTVDRESLFAALRARRTYGATKRGMLIDLRVNSAVMGEELTVNEPPLVRVHAAGTAELAEVVVFRDGRPWKRVAPEAAAPAANGSKAANASPAIANDLAPVRLIVRLPPRVAAPKGGLDLSIDAPGARFKSLDDHRGCELDDAVPTWTIAEGRATLRWPEGWRGRARCAEQPLHLRAPPDSTFTLKRGSTETTATFAGLLAEPVRLPVPGGEISVAIDAGDAAVDLARGLGVREFTQEWKDEKAASGRSWYYARVIQTDGEMAWSSPIYVTRP